MIANSACLHEDLQAAADLLDNCVLSRVLVVMPTLLAICRYLKFYYSKFSNISKGCSLSARLSTDA